MNDLPPLFLVLVPGAFCFIVGFVVGMLAEARPHDHWDCVMKQPCNCDRRGQR